MDSAFLLTLLLSHVATAPTSSVTIFKKREGDIDNNNETTTWTEYWLEGELVHRSVHVTLKKMPPVGGETGTF